MKVSGWSKALWLKVGWNQKYNYTFTWFGVPIIQLPDDMLRYQEVVFAEARRKNQRPAVGDTGSMITSGDRKHDLLVAKHIVGQ